ncbi:PAS domain-containing sensor histidine kinase [Fulvivirga ligni]|uniref:PAS domain-containing sensor histidine kinase n=1 Tax=Fulvivirga ligni TaxID=2904246 RepID=UPI001F2CB2D2|nr:ATP-binding protein [Fulvivirga ligni]UII18977.1 ATP-binding protein [Fulvivirga ligni]
MDRKDAQKLKLKLKERYPKIFHNAHIPIVVTDENGCVVDFNEAAHKQTDYTAEEYAKMNMSQIDVTRNSPEEIQSIVSQIQTNGYAIFEALHRTKTGKILNIIVNASLLEMDGKKYNLAVFNDITHHKKEEHRLLAELAVKQERLEELNGRLSNFAYIASHDLQEPLRTITSYIGVILKNVDDSVSEKVIKYLQVINKSADRMKVLITALLEFSRLGLNKAMVEVNAQEVVEAVINDLYLSIESTDATIEVDDLPKITANATEMRQLFQNLLVNAIKFRKASIAPKIQIGYKELEGYHQFVVSDNGIGMASKNINRIFNIFQKLLLEEEYSGYGIGLANSRKIVEVHGGKIWVETEFGKGSNFYFTIAKHIGS